MKKLKIGKVNQVWASDITYIPMPRGYMYLYAAIDLYSRFMVNWGLSNNMSADWCVTISREALYKWGKPEIFNTDQGAQFTSDHFVDLLKEFKYNKVWMGKEEPLIIFSLKDFGELSNRNGLRLRYVYINPANG